MGFVGSILESTLDTIIALSNATVEDQLEAALKRLRSGPKKSWSTAHAARASERRESRLAC